MVDIRRIRTFW